jgi:hypothetical protein
VPPLRQVLVHYGDEMLVVMPFQQVRQFVDEDIFQALRRLLDKFEVQPDAAGLGVAGAPSGFHLFDAPLRERNPKHRLPFLDERPNQLLELMAMSGE